MSNKAIAETLATTVIVAVLSVLVSRLFRTEMSAADSGGVFGGIMSVYFARRSKHNAS